MKCEDYDKENDRISLLLYKNLRDNFQKTVTNVLGKDYYNMANDVYNADEECCRDITNRCKNLEENLEISGVINIILTIALIFSIVTLIIIK